ncbi:putative carotenoid cleavage dioxygenase 4 chloroplastic [Bienertia sinuspersici]
MDSLSSSFLSSIPQTKVPKILNRNYYSSSLPRIYIYSVRTEDKPQTPTNSQNTKFPKPSSPLPHKSVPAKRYKTQSAPSPKPSLPSTFLNTLDDIINTFIDPPTRASLDPRFILSDNFAPVEELPPTECEIEEGVLPSCLDGAYIRNGPNPQFLPRGPYHLFDGDGMLHSIRISDGKAILCSRYVQTYKYTLERQAGCNILPSVFSGFNSLISSAARGSVSAARMIVGQFNPTNGIGSANTSLAFFGNRLFALNESDLPYQVKLTPNGDIQTVGRNDFKGKLTMSMTAHPKVDLDTGEAFAFRYGPMPPFLTFFRFDSKGNKQPDVPIFSMSPSFLHDFAITKKYAIFPEIQIGMKPSDMIIGGGSPVGLDPTKISRIGVIPRYATDERDMRWFEVPGLNLIHAINAWDEVNKDRHEAIVIVAPNIICAEHTLERMHLVHALVEMIRIDLNTGVVTRQPLSARNLDFAVINPDYVAKKNRYVYAAVGDPMPKITGVVKMDMSVAQDQRECIVASRMFGEGCYGGEPFFVAARPDDPDADEDEGYLVTYVHDENKGESRFLVMDVKSPNLDVVASVKLPQRVPYGFHGLFVRDKDLKGL